MTLRQALRALERLLVDADASLELRAERGGVRAMIVPAKGCAYSAWATDSPAAILELVDMLSR